MIKWRIEKLGDATIMSKRGVNICNKISLKCEHKGSIWNTGPKDN